jgi:hypothetical protein
VIDSFFPACQRTLLPVTFSFPSARFYPGFEAGCTL